MNFRQGDQERRILPSKLSRLTRERLRRASAKRRGTNYASSEELMATRLTCISPTPIFFSYFIFVESTRSFNLLFHCNLQFRNFIGFSHGCGVPNVAEETSKRKPYQFKPTPSDRKPNRRPRTSTWTRYRVLVWCVLAETQTTLYHTRHGERESCVLAKIRNAHYFTGDNLFAENF